MTKHKLQNKAIVLIAFDELSPQFGCTVTEICAQVITYFLQKKGYDLGFNFDVVDGFIYSAELNKLIEETHKLGYLESNEYSENKVTKPGLKLSFSVIQGEYETLVKDTIKSIGQTLDGYANPINGNLLSLVMFYADTVSREHMTNKIIGSNHLYKHYREEIILAAYDRLVEDGFITNNIKGS